MEAKEYKYEPVAQTQVDGEPAPAEDTPNPVEHEQFSTDLFGCFEDHETLCIGLLAPCVLHAQNKERLEGQGHFLPACCAFAWLYGFSHIVLRGGCNVASLLSFQNRRNLRQAYNLQPRSALYDCCAHFWFMSCALCQEARELKIRGATPERPALYPGLHSAVTVVAPAQATMDLEQPANGIPAPQFADPEKPWKK